MTELRTEEEQLEAIKSWWKENGKSTVVGIALAVVLVLGWRGWQANQQAAAENASIAYQNMLQAAMAASEDNPGQLKTAEHLAGQLKSEYEGFGYARYAALWLAKQAVAQGELDRAEAEFNWVLSHEPEPQVEAVTRLRLARVLMTQHAYDQALAQLDQIRVPGFTATAEEVRGDILLAQGQPAEARQAYEAARQALAEAQERPILQMKLDDLAAAGAQ